MEYGVQHVGYGIWVVGYRDLGYRDMGYGLWEDYIYKNIKSKLFFFTSQV